MSWEQLQPYFRPNTGSGAPPGFGSAGSMVQPALEDFYNPTTGQTYTAPHLGMTPGPGWIRGKPPAGTETTPWTGGQATPIGHMAIYDGPQGAWTVNNGAVTFEDGSGQSFPVGYPGQFPGNTGYSNGQWNPNFMTGFPMSNMLPVNKFQGGMPPAISGTLPPLQPTVPTTTTTTPTDGSLPLDYTQHGHPDWEGPDPERVQAHMDRVQQMSEAFYLNNPGHWMSKLDSKLRQIMGKPQLNEMYKDPTTQTRRRMEDLARRRAAQQAESGGGFDPQGGTTGSSGMGNWT